MNCIDNTKKSYYNVFVRLRKAILDKENKERR